MSAPRTLHTWFTPVEPPHRTAALPPVTSTLPASSSSERRARDRAATASLGRVKDLRERAPHPPHTAAPSLAHASLPTCSRSEQPYPDGMGTASPGRERVDRTRAHPAPLPGTPSVHTMHSHSPAPTHHTTGSVPHTQQNQGSVPQLNSEQLTEEVGEHYSERTEEGKGERFQVGLAPQFNSERLTEEGGELHSEWTEEGRGERSHAGSVPQPNPGSVPLQCVQQQQLSHPLNSPILSSPLAPDDTPLLSSATLQKFQQQEHVPPPVQKDFPPAKIRRREAARPHTAGWYNWECPVCQESIRIKGHNNGNYYKQKHLKTVHQTMSKFPTPRSSTTLRCQLRAKQMQALVQPKDQHELVHIHTVDLHRCVPQGTTWICKQCLAKGTTAKMHQYQS